MGNGTSNKKGGAPTPAPKQEQYSFEQFQNEHLNEWGGWMMDAATQTDLMNQGLNAMTIYQLWLDKTGDYEKPQVMGDAEFDQYVTQNGLTPIHRGVASTKKMTAAEMHDITLYADKYYVGEGIHGDGLYFGNHEVAASYAVGLSKVRGTIGKGAVMKAALKPTAKTVNYHDVLSMALHETGHDLRFDNGVLSAYARSKGYDVISIDTGKTGTFLNVLNRGALVVSSAYTHVKL